MAAWPRHLQLNPARSSSATTNRSAHWLLEDAPETYYLTDYYRRWPLIWMRLSRVTPDALRDLLPCRGA